ncbi:hypothetical protein Tco_1442488, partial [Tanacetum coccineum]
PMKNVINNAYSTARRPFNKITAANNSNFTKKVNTVKGTRVNTARPKAVISAVKGKKGNNENSFKPVPQTTTNADGTSTTLIPAPVTTEEKVQKKNDVKAISMLLMALPKEHLMTLNQYKDAQTLFAAIQTRFEEDVNLKFLRSLPSEWNTHVVIWRNKPDLDTMSFDDLYNNFKINKRLKELQAQTQAQVLRIWILYHPLAVLMKLIMLT